MKTKLTKPEIKEVWVITRMYAFPQGSVTHLALENFYMTESTANATIKKNNMNDRYVATKLELKEG